MLFKTLGCILIIAASTGVGINNITALKKRVTALSDISEFINVLKIKMSYMLCDIPTAFSSLEDKYTIAKKCLRYIESGMPMKSAWYRCIDEFSEQMHLIYQDCSLLKDFCICLGETDIEGQISNFDTYLELLKQNLTDARTQLKDRTKVIMSTSMFTGLLISILLI